MSIQTFSLQRDGERSLSRHFKVKDFRCKDGSDTIKISLAHVEKIQRLRDYLNVPFTIVSAYRTPSYNRKIGGATQSRHIVGDATDISVKGLSPKAVLERLVQSGIYFGGIGLYTTFVHLDSRPQAQESRWNNSLFSFPPQLRIKGNTTEGGENDTTLWSYLTRIGMGAGIAFATGLGVLAYKQRRKKNRN